MRVSKGHPQPLQQGLEGSAFAQTAPLHDFVEGLGVAPIPHSTVTLFARFLGWSTSVPLNTAT